jgi:hypothetical protein
MRVALGGRRLDRPDGARDCANGCAPGVFPACHLGPDNTNNVMALAFGVLIVFLVVVGSLLIMADLNDSMMPGPELMNLHMQR